MHPSTADAFTDLLVEAINLTHPRFALAFGREYGSNDSDAAARRERERPFQCEFFHQFRHLWERGLPGQLGLGHLVLQGEPIDVGPLPDWLFWQLGEQAEDRRLGAVSLALATNEAAILINAKRLALCRKSLGYPHAVNIVAGQGDALREAAGLEAPGVSLLLFDTERWTARPIAR